MTLFLQTDLSREGPGVEGQGEGVSAAPGGTQAVDESPVLQLLLSGDEAVVVGLGPAVPIVAVAGASTTAVAGIPVAGVGVCDAFFNVSIQYVPVVAMTIIAITVIAVTIMSITIMTVPVAVPVAIPISVRHAVVDKCTGFIFTELTDQLRLQC